MRTSTVFLALLSVALSALSQVALKAGMISAPVQAAIGTSSLMKVTYAVSQSWLILAGLLSFGLSALVWLSVLSRAPLSTAYPFVALGIVITTAAGFLLFHESFPPMKIVGVLLIACGVIAVATSA